MKLHLSICRMPRLRQGLALLLVTAGCATKPPAKPPKIQLTDMPVYRNTRTDWKTGTSCMVYPCYGKEDDQNVNTWRQHLEALLEKEGYEVVSIPIYMDGTTRRSVDRIIRPVLCRPRSCRIEDGKTVWDLLTVVSVEERAADPLAVEKGVSPSQRYFQVWVRDEDAVPLRKASEALLRVDGFREALEP